MIKPHLWPRIEFFSSRGQESQHLFVVQQQRFTSLKIFTKVPGCEIIDWSWVTMVLLYVPELIKAETGVVIMKRLSHNLWGRRLLSEEFGISWINHSLSESEHLYSWDSLWEDTERWAPKDSCWRLETSRLRDQFSVTDLDQNFFYLNTIVFSWAILCCKGLSYTLQNVEQHS